MLCFQELGGFRAFVHSLGFIGTYPDSIPADTTDSEKKMAEKSPVDWWYGTRYNTPIDISYS